VTGLPSLTARIAGMAAAVLALVPATTAAAQRYAAPSATSTSGTCPAAAPCRIDYAVNGAAAGDEVIVASGTYAVGAVMSPNVALAVHGVPDEARPVLVGADTLPAALLSFKAGGSLRHLELRATAPGQDALTLQRGLAEDVVLVSASGDAAKVVGAQPATVLRDAVARSSATMSGAAALKLRESPGPGDVALRNVTAIAPSQIGIRCEVSGGQGTLVNVIARGAQADVDAQLGGTGCSAAFSSLRPDRSPGLRLGPAIQAAEPRFTDAAAGDYRPVDGSPTVDAGSTDALVGTADPDGRPRTLGAAPDIGAYEYPGYASAALPAAQGPGGASGPPPAPAPDAMPADLRGVPVPILGDTVVVAPGPGHVLVRRPGRPRFKRLTAPTRLPLGSVLDASRGRLRLVSAVDADGRMQTGRFWGGRFAIAQDASGMTSLRLRGGDFSVCPRTAAASRIGMRGISSSHVVRSLWSRDRGGRFRTFGHNSVATARGTAWVTRDRCDGTLVRVAEGAVAVRDRASGRTVVVRAGHARLVRARG
jgi:hypothetical protein